MIKATDDIANGHEDRTQRPSFWCYTNQLDGVESSDADHHLLQSCACGNCFQELCYEYYRTLTCTSRHGGEQSVCIE